MVISVHCFSALHRLHCTILLLSFHDQDPTNGGNALIQTEIKPELLNDEDNNFVGCSQDENMNNQNIKQHNTQLVS